jgi:hypothetical protein
MTVAELIAALKDLPQNMQVVLMDEEGEGSYDIDEIDTGVIDDGGKEVEVVRLFP